MAGPSRALPLSLSVGAPGARITSARRARCSKDGGLATPGGGSFRAKRGVIPRAASFSTSCRGEATFTAMGSTPSAIPTGPTSCRPRIIKGRASAAPMAIRTTGGASAAPIAGPRVGPSRRGPTPISACAGGTTRPAAYGGTGPAYATLSSARRSAGRPFSGGSPASGAPSPRPPGTRKGLGGRPQTAGPAGPSATGGAASTRARAIPSTPSSGTSASAFGSASRTQAGTAGTTPRVSSAGRPRVSAACITCLAATPCVAYGAASLSTFGPSCGSTPAAQAADGAGPCGLCGRATPSGIGSTTRTTTFRPAGGPFTGARGGLTGAGLTTPARAFAFRLTGGGAPATSRRGGARSGRAPRPRLSGPRGAAGRLRRVTLAGRRSFSSGAWRA